MAPLFLCADFMNEVRASGLVNVWDVPEAGDPLSGSAQLVGIKMGREGNVCCHPLLSSPLKGEERWR